MTKMHYDLVAKEILPEFMNTPPKTTVGGFVKDKSPYEPIPVREQIENSLISLCLSEETP